MPLLAVALLLAPPASAEAPERTYDLSLGGGAGAATAGLAHDCVAEGPSAVCKAARIALGSVPALGGVAFDAKPVVGRSVRAEARDGLSTLPHLALGIDVDGDGCVGCTSADVVNQGCGAVDGIVLHTTRGERLTVFVHSLWLDPATAETCIAASGTVRLLW